MFQTARSSWILAGLLMSSTVSIVSLIAAIDDREYKSGIVWPEPALIDPGPSGGPPSDAIVLFNGKDLSQWKGGENWEVKDGIATARKNDISTMQSFGDCQLHVEFATPAEAKGSGQGRGNSGIYMMGRYEVQILDSFENATDFDGQCGALYKQQPPTVNASRRPGEWQAYDIVFESPRFDDAGKLTKPAIVTVLHNGVLIHNHVELQGTTSYFKAPEYELHPEKQPIEIQFHGNPVQFRKIWIRENVRSLEGKKPSQAIRE